MGFGPVATGDRNVELGVPPHAVLVDVETLRLDVLLDADAPDEVHRLEDGEGETEREGADGEQADRLDAELVEAAAVGEALGAGGKCAGGLRQSEDAGR